MIFARLLLLMSLTTGTAQAEVTIRSGEHDTFSRLVFTLPRNMEWSVIDTPAGPGISVADPSQHFDTSQVFSRIPRTRLQDLIDETEGRLRLDLNCDCPVTSFQLDGRVFVVDILDPTDPEPQEETAARSPQPVGSGPALRGDLGLPVVPRPQTGEGIVPPLGFRTVRVPYTTTPPVAARPSVAEARTRLVETLGQSADLGVLSAPGAESTDATLPPLQTEAAHGTTSALPTDAPGVVPQNRGGLSLDTSSEIDEALAGAVSRVFGAKKTEVCIPDDVLDVHAWAEGHGFQQETGRLNRQLFGEFDRIDPDIALRLSRLYIHFGFGAEALFVLELLETPSPEKDILTAMAQALEFGSAPKGQPFEDQEFCDTAAALWSVASNESLASAPDLNRAAILRSFDALPPHLRDYLGPRLSKRLRDASRIDAAEGIMRIVTRGNRPADATTDMEISEIASQRGDTEAAETGFTAVVAQDASPSPEALVRLIDLRIDQGKPIDAAHATLAASYAFELRDTEIGGDLQRAHVLALSDTGDFRPAMQGLGALADGLPPERAKRTHDLVLTRVTEGADDETFLLLVLPYLTGSGQALSPSTQNSIAERLLGLGITQHVGPLLANSLQGSEDRDRRVLRSRLAALEERPRNAVAHLLGLEGEDIDLLRAQAFAVLGEYERAGALYARHGHDAEAEQMALLAKDWAYLRENGSGALEMAAVQRLDASALDFTTPGLARSRAALESAAQTRADVTGLVNAFRVDSTTFDPPQ